ncbi:uncharacterized protein TNCV_3459071 [Trichonephila clavipes]|nr:uncharacterized protein TNCV_3459071 [Trichonephila clavipes]
MIFLRGRIIGRLECGRTQLKVSEELGITQSVISRLWQRFQDDGSVSRCYSTGRPRVTTPNEDRYIWQLLPKETDGAQHQTCLVSYRYDSFKADRVQTLRAHWSICSAIRHIQLLSFEICTRQLYPQDTVHVEGTCLKTEDENKQQFSCCVDH